MASSSSSSLMIRIAKTFPLLLLLTTVALISAEVGHRDEDGTELNPNDIEQNPNDIGTTSRTTGPTAPDAEPLDKQIKDKKSDRAEISQGILDETEVEAELEKEMKEKTSSDDTLADQMNVRRKQLEEALAHIRNSVLEHHPQISSQDAAYEASKSEDDKSDELTKEESNEFEHQDGSLDKPTRSIFTLEPYFVISEKILSSLDPYLEDMIRTMPPTMQRLFLKAPFTFTPPRNLLLFVGSFLLMLITLSCGYSRSSRQRSEQNEKNGLLQKLSTLQEALLISEQEKESVAGELESLKEQCKEFRNQSTTTTEQAEELSTQISKLEEENEALQEKLSQQQSVKTDLSAKVSSQSESIKKLSEKHKNLQKSLEETSLHKNLLETQLCEIQATFQESQSGALEMQSQLQLMTEEIAILQTSKDQLLLEADGWNEKVREQGDQISTLLEQEKTLLESNGLKEKELSVLRDCYQRLKLFENSIDCDDSANREVDEEEEEEDEEMKKKRKQDEVQQKIKSMIDVAQINARLNAAEEEKSSLKNALKIEMESRMEFEDRIKQLKGDMEMLMESRQVAEQQASTTAIKMDVLVNYFKEKEAELTRKLGEQEARERVSADQLVSTDEKTKEFEQMVHLYKEQVEDLQKEIKNIEADFRKQIALQEKKAHENWLVARQSERDVKEYKAEAHILRLKILELQNRLDAVTAESKGTQELGQTIPGIANGSVSTLPNEDRPTSRPLLPNPVFGLPPPFAPGPFLPADRPLPPPLFGHPLHPPPPMMFDRLPPEMRSPLPFDLWSAPQLHRSPVHPRDRSPPRGRSPSPPHRGVSPESQRSHMSPSSLHIGRSSPTYSRNQSPPPVAGERQFPYSHGPRIPPSGAARPVRPPYNRAGHDSRSGH